ncbi:hypothetical protein J5X84_41525 [Streptosporangiaceae bacterium NEAU-GS5]|nr:hypothetical protein [Streptosporangiaceae bacterium NEAU-GS5]
MNIRALAAAVGAVAAISAGSIYAAAPANAGPPPLCVRGDLTQGWCDRESLVNIDPHKMQQTTLTCPSRAVYVTAVGYQNTGGEGSNPGGIFTVLAPSPDHTKVPIRVLNPDDRNKLFGKLSWSCRNVYSDVIDVTYPTPN